MQRGDIDEFEEENARQLNSCRKDRITTRDKREAMTDFLALIYAFCLGQAAVAFSFIPSQRRTKRR